MTIDEQYNAWRENPGPDTMSGVLDSADTYIVSELSRYKGPRDILHSKARRLAVDAVKSYDPTRGASLRTWITSNLRPLNRYGQQISVVRTPEVTRRRAAEMASREADFESRTGRKPNDAELADEIGISVGQIVKLRQRAPASISGDVQPTYESDGDEGGYAVENMMLTDTNAAAQAFDIVYSGLDERTRFIVDSRTGRGNKPVLSNIDIARRLGVSPAYVSQVAASVAEKVKKVAYAG